MLVFLIVIALILFILWMMGKAAGAATRVPAPRTTLSEAKTRVAIFFSLLLIFGGWLFVISHQ